MTTKTTSYPWDDLQFPKTSEEYVARRVSKDDNPQHREVFWAMNVSGRPALLVEYESDSQKHTPLPTFKNILVTDHQNQTSLVIELLDLDSRDMFLEVCMDIIAALQDVEDRQIRTAAILRLERWSSFLRPSRARLSSEAQKGLIAELHFFKRDALEIYGEADALDGWVGPETGARDFSYGQVFIEVKSKRNSANTNITISSEDQLNINPSEQLFLYVAELNDAPTDDESAFTISDLVTETRNAIRSPLQRANLDNKLAKAGYFDEDDYSDTKWSEGEAYYYAVIDDFPRIDSKSCKPGVSKVAYQIDLDYCDEFKINRNVVIDAME